MDYRFVSVPDAFCERVRRTLRDDAGNTLTRWISDGPGNPCRSCLRLTQAGEQLILCAYTPFGESGPYVECGPIFIHADACTAYDPGAGYPADFEARAMTLRSYGPSGRNALSILAAEVAPAGEAARTLDRLFADPRAVFVHARNPAWGCYDFRIDRAP